MKSLTRCLMLIIASSLIFQLNAFAADNFWRGDVHQIIQIPSMIYFGKVYDTQGNPIKYVKISASGKTTYTDNEGNFELVYYDVRPSEGPTTSTEGYSQVSVQLINSPVLNSHEYEITLKKETSWYLYLAIIALISGALGAVWFF